MTVLYHVIYLQMLAYPLFYENISYSFLTQNFIIFLEHFSYLFNINIFFLCCRYYVPEIAYKLFLFSLYVPIIHRN